MCIYTCEHSIDELMGAWGRGWRGSGGLERMAGCG